jgi:hypothetical protein
MLRSNKHNKGMNHLYEYERRKKYNNKKNKKKQRQNENKKPLWLKMYQLGLFSVTPVKQITTFFFFR